MWFLTVQGTFCNKPAKTFYDVRTIIAKLPPFPFTSKYAFSWNTTPPPRSIRILWMAPKLREGQFLQKKIRKEIIFISLVFFSTFLVKVLLVEIFEAVN